MAKVLLVLLRAHVYERQNNDRRWPLRFGRHVDPCRLARARGVDASQILQTFVRGQVASLRILLQGFVDDRRQGCGEVGVQRLERRGRPIQELVENRGDRSACERSSPGRHLEKNDPKREKVRARVECLSERLLRRHVPDGAKSHARAGLPPHYGFCVPSRPRREKLGQPEVENLDAIVFGNHDVTGLQIPVQNSRGMGTGKALGHLSPEGQRLRERKRGAGAQELPQAAALNELHCDEEQTVVGFVDRVEMHDVGVVECRGGFGLPLEARAAIGRFTNVRTEKLERHPPIELRVLGGIDHSHAAAPEFFKDEVMT